MSNQDLFYICGIALAVSAVLVSFIALRFEKFPGRATPVVVLWFMLLVGGATTFSVLHAQDEEHHKAAEFAEANEEITKEEASPVESEEAPAQPATKGPGSTLELAADPTALAFDTTKLTSKAGEVTIDFDNPAALEHNVAIDENDKEIAVSDTITEGKTSVTTDLAPGTYTFLCTVPGHAEAGMQGTLVVN